jgi:hypothetical protein
MDLTRTVVGRDRKARIDAEQGQHVTIFERFMSQPFAVNDLASTWLTQFQTQKS